MGARRGSASAGPVCGTDCTATTAHEHRFLPHPLRPRKRVVPPLHRRGARSRAPRLRVDRQAARRRRSVAEPGRPAPRRCRPQAAISFPSAAAGFGGSGDQTPAQPCGLDGHRLRRWAWKPRAWTACPWRACLTLGLYRRSRLPRGWPASWRRWRRNRIGDRRVHGVIWHRELCAAIKRTNG